MSNNEDADFLRTEVIETRARELAAEWMADDPLQYLEYIYSDSFSPTDADLLRRWLTGGQDVATAARLDESAGIILRTFVREYAAAQGLRVAENTRGLMDTHFAGRIERLL